MNILARRKLRRTTLICMALISVMVGLFASFHGLKIQGMWLLVIPPLLLIKKFWYFELILIIFIAITIGMWRGGYKLTELKRYQPLYGKVITVRGKVADDSGYNQERNQTEFHINALHYNNGTLPGRIQVALSKDPLVLRGDEIVISGKLRPSKGASKQGTLNQASVVVMHKNTSVIESLRTKFFRSVDSALPEPYAGLGMGYLVGLRVSIPKELNEQLAIVGLTHIIAVSGYNLTVIVQAVQRILGKYSAYQSVVFSLLLVAGFIVVAGGSAPIMRAAVVCVASLLAWYYGRVLSPLLLLLLSGAVTAFVNPLYIWGDPGWYLSFLAFAGVLIIAPLIIARYFTNKPPGTIMQILIETLCAQIATIPYTLYLFGGVSIIAPVANIVVLPFIPFIMVLVFLLGLIGMIAPTLAMYIGFVPTALLTFQVWLIKVLSEVPGAHAGVTISAATMMILFSLLLYVVITLSHSVTKKRNHEIKNLQQDLL